MSSPTMSATSYGVLHVGAAIELCCYLSSYLSCYLSIVISAGLKL